MKIELKKLTKKFEIKISLYFALGAFIISLLTGLIKGVDFFILIKRILMAEIFYIPIGYGVGYLILYYFSQDQFQNYPDSSIENDTQIKKSSTISGSNSEIIKEKEEINSEISQTEPKIENQENQLTDKKENKEEINYVPEYNNLSLEEQIERVSKISPKDLGKHLIIENKKIINDPQAMAQAIRTIMNKE